MWLHLAISLFIVANLQATYFKYTYAEDSTPSPYEITWEELRHWEELAHKTETQEKGPSYEIRLQAYLMMAQNDFVELGKEKGSVGYLSNKIITLFDPEFKVSPKKKGLDDAFSIKLGDIVFEKYKARFDEEHLHPQVLKEGGGWKGETPYFGLDESSMKPWYVDAKDFMCTEPPSNATFWELQMDEVNLFASSITPEQKKLVDLWASTEGDMLKMVDQHMYEQNTPIWKRALIRSILASAQSDTCAACFLSKYTYLIKRPFMYQKGFKPVINTPNHPSYPSAHSTVTSMMVVLLNRFLPDPKWKRIATEAGISRLYGGIHYPIDHVNGQELGTRIGKAILNDW